MNTTIVVSVYNNVKALKLIIESILNQSVKVNEIIISEDGESQEMKDYVSTLQIEELVHLTQEDLGWRKNIALNRSIKKAKGEYLIFIDGDVILHKDFVKGHISCSEEKSVCVGKRSGIGKEYSEKLYNKEITIDEISNKYFRFAAKLHGDKVHHYQEGIYSPILNKLTAKRRIRHILGCNFSCFKKDIEAINGFDEDYKLPSVGEDTDLTWRFLGLGIKMKSCRYLANVYHLWHKVNFGDKEDAINRAIMNNNMEKKQFVCLNGLEKLGDES